MTTRARTCTGTQKYKFTCNCSSMLTTASCIHDDLSFGKWNNCRERLRFSAAKTKPAIVSTAPRVQYTIAAKQSNV